MQRGRWGARGGARRASPIATKPPLGCRGPGGVTSWTMTGETSTDPSDAPRALARCGSGHSRWRARAGGGLQVRHAALPGRRDAQATSQRRRPALHDVRRELRPGAGGGPALRQHRPVPYGEPLCHVQRALRAIVPLRAPDPRRARAGRPTPPRGMIARFPARIVATARSSTRGRASRCEPCRRDRAPGGRRHTRARPAAACRLAPPGAPHSRASSPPS